MFCNRMVSVQRIACGRVRADFPFSPLIRGTGRARQRFTQIHTSAVCALKEIVHREEKGVTVIEGTFVDSHHKDKLLQPTLPAVS